jgi:hypothetical protein
MDDVSKVFLKSYIIGYVDSSVSWEISQTNHLSGDISINLSVIIDDFGKQVYRAPELGSEGENAQRFIDAAEKNSDRSYNREDVFLSYMDRICSIDKFKMIKIICLNRNWDSNHPQGSDLGDIVTTHILSYADYIRNHYVGESYHIIKKTVSELSLDDLAMFTVYGVNSPRFYFDVIPVPGKYEIQVTLLTCSGEERVVNCILII